MKKRKTNWLLPTILILFLCEIVTLPLILSLTYAGNAEAPDHTLILSNEKTLQWATGTHVRPDGMAEFAIFSDEYYHVKSDNGDTVIAPGTEASSLVRLRNDTAEDAPWIATLYLINEDDKVPVTAGLKCGGTPTETAVLPEGVTNARVLASYTGVVPGKGTEDFDTSWFWTFYESDELDIRDTKLGNDAAWNTAAEIKLGLYIVIEGDDGPITPVPTGDNPFVLGYVVLLVISGALLLLELIGSRRRKKKTETDPVAQLHEEA